MVDGLSNVGVSSLDLGWSVGVSGGCFGMWIVLM